LNVTGLSTLAAVNATTVNATTGFRISSSAPANHILVGNGTNYVDSATLPSAALPALGLYYQTVDLSGTAQTQRPELNFNSTLFTATDSASPARTLIGLNAPGTGTRVATLGSDPGASTALAAFDGSKNLIPSSVVAITGNPGRITLPGGVIMQWFTGTTITAGEPKDVTMSLPVAFPTACDSVQVTYHGTSGSTNNDWYILDSCTTTQVTIGLRGTGGSDSNAAPEILAIGH
jgi:hypothetical protein